MHDIIGYSVNSFIIGDNVNWGVNRMPPECVWLEHGLVKQYLPMLYRTLGTMFTGITVRCGLARLKNEISIAPTDVYVAGAGSGRLEYPSTFNNQQSPRGHKKIGSCKA
jgi:hypothetical protein